MRRLALVLVIALAGGGALGACDAFTDDDETQRERTDDDEQTDDEGGGGEDQELAEDIVLTLDDLPEGFAEREGSDDEETDGEDDDGLSPADEEFEDCADAELIEELEEIEEGEGGGGSAESPEFESEADFLFVNSAAFVAPNDDLSTALFDLFTGECFGDALATGFEEDATGDDAQFSDITVAPIDDLPALGDETGGFSIRGTAGDASGLTFEIAFDFAIVRDGRVVAFALVGGLLAPFPSAERDALLEVMAERMEPA